MISTSPDNVYQEVQVSTANGLKLVVMLYEGLIRFISQAKSSIQNKNYADKAVALDRALAIVGELQSTLNLREGGEIAESLDRLYTYMTERLLQASANLDTRLLDEVIKLLKTLNSAWSESAQKGTAQGNRSIGEAAILPPRMESAGGTRSSLELFG
jgi:flagellar protein FliS